MAGKKEQNERNSKIRRFRQAFKETLVLMIQDLRNVWAALAVLVFYFLLGRRFLYSLCPCVVLTGFPCPACGMTRAVLCILQGRFAEAWDLHPFSYMVLAFCIVFAARRYFLKKEVKSLEKYLLAVFLGMLCFYVYRMIRYFPGEAPMSYYYGSVGYRIYNMLNGF